MNKNLYTVAITAIISVLVAACGNGASAGKVLEAEDYAMAITTDTTAVLIDVRTPEEYVQGHIAGARLMDVCDEPGFMEVLDTLPSGNTYYIYCRSGRRSRKAAGIMMERGLEVVDLKGGYNAWVERDSMAGAGAGRNLAE